MSVIDVTKNLFYVLVEQENEHLFICKVQSVFASSEYKLSLKQSELLLAELYCLGYALVEIQNLEIDATVFISRELYQYYYLGVGVDARIDNILKPYLAMAYENEHSYARIFRIYTNFGEVIENRIKRTKISITPNETMKFYQNYVWKKGDILSENEKTRRELLNEL